MRLLVSLSNGATWIAEEDGQMAGFAIVEWNQEPDGVFAYIQTIEVAAEQHGCGVGLELLLRIEGSARHAGAGLPLRGKARELLSTGPSGVYLQETAGCRGRELAAFSFLHVRPAQYRQLVRSAPAGAVFCMRSRILGMYMVL